MKKRILSLLLAMCLIVGVFPMGASAATVTERENNDTMGTAQSITANDTISGSISTDGDVDFYKFTLSSAGRVHIFHKAYSKYYSLGIYDINGNCIWKAQYHEWNEAVGFQTGDYDIDFESGTYFLKVTASYYEHNSSQSTGKYTTQLTFTSANTNYPEPNNSIDQASQISLGSQVRGLIACNDDYDFYSFILSNPQKIYINHTAYSQYYSLGLYDAKGKRVWETQYHEWNKSVGYQTGSFDINLESGTYYLKVTASYYEHVSAQSTGRYNFTITTDGSTTDPVTPTPKPEKVAVTGVSLDKASLELEEGETANLTAVVKPTNADNKSVTWSSSDTSVATVSSGGTVKAVSEGTATVTVKTNDGGYTAVCTVTVTADNDDKNLKITSFGMTDDITKPTTHGTINEASSMINITLPYNTNTSHLRFYIETTGDYTVYLSGTLYGIGNYYDLNGLTELPIRLVNKNSERTYTLNIRIADNPGNSFTDVPSNAYYADAVKWAVENNITSGTDETHFSPNSSCSRAQAVTFLWRLAGSPSVSSSSKFSDVGPNAYYSQAVSWAVQKGITSGVSKTKFKPDTACTRAQIVTFLYRAAGKPSISSGGSFGDVKSGDYFSQAVRWAVENNITSGTSSNRFSPNNNCIRAQIVTFLYRYSN